MLEIMWREWKLLVHERAMVLFVLLFAATAYALLIGNLYKGGIVQNIPVAVCNLDDSALSREFMQMTAEADQYAFSGSLPNVETAEAQLAAGEIAAAVIIPPDFTEKYYRGETVTVAFLQDGSNTLQAGYALAPMQTVCAEFNQRYADFAARAQGTPTVSPAAVAMSMRTYGNATQSYLSFYMYGVMLMAAQIGMIMGFAMSVYEDLRQDFFYQNGIGKVLGAKILLYWFLSLLSVCMAIFILIALFDMPLRGAISKIILLAAAFLLAVEGLGGIAALYFKTRLALVQAMVFYTLPAFLLSGYIWPETGMVDVVKWISLLQPVHYALSDFRNLALIGSSPDYWLDVGILLGTGSIALVLLYAFLCWGKERNAAQGC